MELIYHMPAQIFWYVYFSIVADYSYFMNSLIEVTRSLIHDVCTEFGFFIYLLNVKREQQKDLRDKESKVSAYIMD